METPHVPCPSLRALRASAALLLLSACTPAGNNRAPTANAGPDQTVKHSAQVRLDGTGSSDPDGDDLSYHWEQTSGPVATLPRDAEAATSFMAPADVGTLTFTLTVDDGHGGRATDSVNLTVTNTAPVALAGADITVSRYALVQLSGTGTDADGDVLGYSWNQVDGQPVHLDSSQVPRPQFTAPGLTGELTFAFRVTDGVASSEPATVKVTVTNHRPQAHAGDDATVARGSTVELQARVVDPDSADVPTITWTQLDGPAVTLSGAHDMFPTFTAPQGPGVMRFSLVVSDGELASEPDEVVITTQNAAPVARAGAPQTVAQQATVHLDGTGSTDPDGDALTYQWQQVSGPPVALDDDAAASPAFTAPASVGALVFELSVTDGQLRSAPAQVTVTLANRPPVASAGMDQSVVHGRLARLDGTGSSDPDGNALSYQWQQLAGTAVTLDDPSSATPSFAAPQVLGSLEFQVVVGDGLETSAPAVVHVQVTNINPVADAGADQAASRGVAVTLHGSGTDSDQDQLQYAWQQTGGTPVTLDDSTSVQPAFTTPAVTGDLEFQLVVRDGVGISPPDSVRVSVTNTAPTAHAGDDLTAYRMAEVMLQGSGTDPDVQDVLRYSWTQTGGPSVALQDAHAATAHFTAPNGAALLRFALVVEDGDKSAPADTVQVTVVNRPPTVSAGTDQAVNSGEVVWLRAAGQDADQDVLQYAWTQVSGTPVRLSSKVSTQPFFRAPAGTGSLTFRVTASDGMDVTAPDDVTVSVRAYNGPRVSLDRNPLVPSWPGTGEARGVTADGNLVYIAGNGLDALDLADPAAPVERGTSAVGTSYALAAANGRAYVALGAGGVASVDLTDLTPLLRAWPGRDIRAVAVDGEFLYLVDHGNALLVVDNQVPTQLDSATVVEVPVPGAEDVTAHAGRAYVSGSGVNVVDPHSPGAPLPALPQLRTHGMAWLGSSLVVATDTGVTVATLDAQGQPQDASSVELPRGVSCLHVSGETVAAAGGSTVTLYVATGAQLSRVGRYALDGRVQGLSSLVTNGRTWLVAAVGSTGVQWLDITVPSLPTFDLHLSTPSPARGVATQGTTAYLVQADALQVVDLRDLAVLGSAALDPASSRAVTRRVSVIDNVLFTPSRLGMHFLDVGDPSAPVPLGSWDVGTPGPSSTEEGMDLLVQGGRLVLAATSQVDVVDVSQPRQPVRTRALAGTAVAGAAADGDVVYLIDNSTGDARLQVLDGVQGASTLVDHLGDVQRLDVADGVAFLGAGAEGLKVVTLANPGAGARVAWSGAWAGQPAVVGPGLLVAADTSGATWLDLESPAAPSLAGRFLVDGETAAAVESNGRVLLAGSAGLSVAELQVVQLDPPQVTAPRGSTLTYAVAWLAPSGAADTQVVCRATAGTCSLDQVDPVQHTARLSWHVPSAPGDQEVLVAAGNGQFFGVARERLSVQ